MSVASWVKHFSLTRTPFTKTIPANQLFAREGHAEAVARIQFCVQEAALGLISGDVGAEDVPLSVEVWWWSRVVRLRCDCTRRV